MAITTDTNSKPATVIRRRNTQSEGGTMAKKNYDPKQVTETAEVLKAIKGKSQLDPASIMEGYLDDGLRGVIARAQGYGTLGGKVRAKPVMDAASLLKRLGHDAEGLEALAAELESTRGGPRGKVPPAVGDKRIYNIQNYNQKTNKPITPKVMVPLLTLKGSDKENAKVEVVYQSEKEILLRIA